MDKILIVYKMYVLNVNVVVIKSDDYYYYCIVLM